MKAKALFDKKENRFFTIKSGRITYTTLPKILEIGEIVNYKQLTDEMKEYIEENCIIKYLNISIVKQKEINCRRGNKKQFKLSDYYLMKENREMGITYIKNTYFPSKTIDAVKSFYSRMHKKEKEGWL